MTDTKPARATFNTELQGLRAVAILMVVTYHAQRSLLSGGYIGVDVFFVISGFLITGLLAREAEATGTVRLWRFYARRARRLLPAAVLVLVATVVMARLTYSPLELRMFGSVATTTALYVGNFWFAHLATDYLRAGDADMSPLLHYWSLCVEEQFYLLWPPLILLLLWAFRKSRRVDSVLIVGLAGVGLVSLVTSIVLTRVSQPWGFFGTPARAWEFAFGGMTVLMVGRRGAVPAGVANAIAVIGLACVASSAFLFDQQTSVPGSAALLPVVGTCLVLAMSTRERGTGVTSFLRTRPLQVLGDLSYSWYLWHWPVMLLLRDRGGVSLATGAAGAVISLGLAWLTFTLIENPIRSFPPLVARDRLSIACGLLLAVVGAGAGLGVRQSALAALDSPAQRRYQTAVEDVARVYADGCHAAYLAVDLLDCTYGRTSSDSTMVLIGDSHAAQWFPAAEAVALRRGWRLVSLTKSACPPFVYEPFDDAVGRSYAECSVWQRRMLQRVAELRPALVILGVSSRYSLRKGGNGNAPPEIELWRSGVRETLNRLRPVVGNLVLLRDTPVLAESAPKCLSRAEWRGEDTATACVFEPAGAPSRIPEQIAIDEIERAGFGAVVDMGPAICPRGPCGDERDGLVLYMDDHHLTTTFSRTLAPELDMRITEAVRAVRKPHR